MAQNPGTGGPIPPLGLHQDPGPPNPPAIPIQGRLVHAPYSFQTVTGASGALAYIAGAFPGGLPWNNGSGYIVEKVVIHCLPGLYGPRLQGQPIVDPTVGKPWNGEAFPALLQHGVSIRGTSCLATIFDARGEAGPIFETNAPQFTARNQHDFINGVTIRGARSTESDPRGAGAGVYIHGMGSDFMTVSNCFITDNTVGIAVASEIDPKQEPLWVHFPKIVNNTIAWNSIGIWNGDFGPLTVQSAGLSPVQVLNNIIDCSPPDVTQHPVPASAFEGISSPHMWVAGLQSSTGSVTVNQHMNAWPLGYQNFGTAVANWPSTQLTGANPATARYDLTQIVGAGITARNATLYVNDALRNKLGYDHSPHDFRLAPVARPHGTQQGQPNPLVNLGVALTGIWIRIQMAPVDITSPPGPGSAANVLDPPATMHCWDWDADGTGNPRIVARAGFLPSPWQTDIDMGADEMDALIMAGYVDKTRIYSHNIPNAPFVPDHSRVFFLDLSPPTGTYTRPVYNWFIGGYEAGSPSPTIYYPWWTHVQTPVNAVPGTNYTAGYNGAAGQSSRNVVLQLLGRPPFMRNLMCDVSPHLVQDPHPLWAYYFNIWFEPYFQVTRTHDVYASHPWYDATRTLGISWGIADNPYLFHNPPLNPYVPSSNDWNVQFHRVTLGITSPPGSFFIGGSASYLLGGIPTFQFGPWGTCTPAVAGEYTVDALGVGDAGTGCPDMLPVFPGLVNLGIRMNCQRFANGVFSGNLQSFLVVTTDSESPVDAALWSGGNRRARVNVEPYVESMRRLDRARDWLRGLGW